EEILGNNSIEDISWLCSLSESELDFLISLKKLAVKRAIAIGHVQLANKFDLKVLPGFILMECLKEKVKDLSLIPSLLEPVMSIEELKNHIAFKARKEFYESICLQQPEKEKNDKTICGKLF
ncbi:hypothetical protein ES332_D10G054500v1, partial [Gossypium tomentosum]